MSILNRGSPGTLILELGLKNTYGSGFRSTLFFSADPIIFSMRLNVPPYFLRVVVGSSYSVPKWHLLSQYLLNIMNNMILKRPPASVPHNKTVTENVNARKVYSSG